MGAKKGFTLIEVLIATAIMLSVCGALVYGFSQCSQVIETARNSDIALNAIQEKLEEIADSESIVSYHEQPVDTTGLPPGGPPDEVAAIRIGDTDLWNVTATVNWPQRGKMLSRELTTTFIQK